jgi:hypothetical protein
MTSHRLRSVPPPGPLTMVDVERVIDCQRDAFVQHPFLTRLEGEGTLEQFRRMLPRFAFFTLVFQDVLRLARERCTDPQVRAIATGLERGDRGHDQWYLQDLERLGIPLDIPWMFSSDHALSRDAEYKLVSEVLSVTDDRARLAVTLSLEAIAREFFVRVTKFAERVGASAGLNYFGARHLAAESGHEVFGGGGQSQLAAIKVPDQVVQEVLFAVEHTFDAMVPLADDLAAALGDGGR